MADNDKLPPLLDEEVEQPAVDPAPTEDAQPEVPEQAPAEAPEDPNRKTNISSYEFASRIGPLLGGLFLLYLIVSGNFVGELFSCHLQHVLSTNYAIKHLLGAATLFFFVNLVAPDIPWHKGIVAGVTLAMYLLFVISNRTETTCQLINVGLLFVMYILQMIRNEQEDDEDMTDRIITAQWAVACVILAIVLYGHILFIGKKRIEFRGRFSYLNLFKGSTCRNMDAHNYGWSESLQAFFGKFKEAQATPSAQSAVAPSLAESPAFMDAASFFDNGSGMSSQYSDLSQ
jgi:hypothetical protein